MTTVESIASELRDGGRITADEALTLWSEAPLWLLGSLAFEAKRRVSGDKVFYNRNFHIEPSNICMLDCKFCSFRRSRGEEGAWDCSMDEVAAMAAARRGSGATEVHIVGGVHPEHDIYYYAEMIRSIRKELPDVCVKAFTAVELDHMIRKAGLATEEGLRILKDAGLESIPGGGAEIFSSDIRSRICPQKGTAEEWLALHAAAHRMGIDSNATMLYGHIENIGHRINHLLRLREQQDETGGFNAFIPLKYRAQHNPLSWAGETSITDDLRTLAMSRLILDNVPHIKAYWVMYGKQSAELALSFGADDIDGTIEDSTKIYSMAGADDKRPVLTIEEIWRMCHAAGLRAVERDTHYNEIIRP